MGIKRIVDVGFWNDEKNEDMTKDERYFFLFLLTNPHANMLGIYKITPRQAAFYTGLTQDEVRTIISHLTDLGIIYYSNRTGEIAIKNYLRHSIVRGGIAVHSGIIRDLRAVKDRSLIEMVFEHLANKDDLNTTVSNIVERHFNGNGVTDTLQTRDTENGNADRDADMDRNKNGNKDDMYIFSGDRNSNDNGVTDTLQTRDTPSRRRMTFYSSYGKYGNVKLTDDEMESLQGTRAQDWEERIQRLDDWLQNHPNRTIKNHYQTILKWAAEDDAKPKPAPDVPGAHFALENPNYGGTISKYTVDLFADDEEEGNE